MTYVFGCRYNTSYKCMVYNYLDKISHVNIRLANKCSISQHNTVSKFLGSFNYQAPNLLNKVLDLLPLNEKHCCIVKFRL